MKQACMRTLVLAALAGCVPAWGQVTTGSASVSGLSFELFDLAPDDGIAASLTWDSAYSSVSASSSFGTVLTPGPDGTWSFSFADSGGTTAEDGATFLPSLTSSFGGSSAFIDGQGVGASMQTDATGSSDSVFAFSNGTFTLSAMTGLRITGSLNLSVSGPDSSGFDVPSGTAETFSQLYSHSFAYGGVFLNGGSVYADASLSGENYTTSTDPLLPTASFGQSSVLPFSLVWLNETGQSFAGDVLVQAAVSGQQAVMSVMTPVPEPETWAMWLIGMAALVAVRRRKAHALH